MTNKRKKELEFDKYGLPMPPKTLSKAMIEAAKDADRKGKELPKNVIKAAKKIASRVPPKPPGKMPISIRMNKINRGKIQKSLGKSVRTGSDKSKKFTKGGVVGGQKKLDMNKDGKLTKVDFQMLGNKSKAFKGKIDTDKEKLVSENGKTMVVKKAKGGSIQVSGTNFSGVY
jgi:hypothetical protein